MAKKFLLMLGAGLLATLLSGCEPGDDKKAAAAPPPPASVIVAKVEQKKVSPTSNFVGQTEAIESVDLRARVEGYIKQRLFTEGGRVEKDQLLFVLEKAAYQANLGAKAEVRVKAAALKTAELNLSYTEIRAPIKGRIGRETYSVGNLVNAASDPLANVVSQDPIYVTFAISERIFTESQLKAMEQGRTAVSETDILPSLKFSNGTFYSYVGQLVFIDPKVDQLTGTVRIRSKFPNPDGALLPGQFVTVVLELSEPKDTLLVPQAAVQEDQSGRFVLVVGKDNKIEVRRISVGQRDGIYWAVESGLSEGEAVVYQGIQKARPGAVVAPVFKAPASPDQQQEAPQS